MATYNTFRSETSDLVNPCATTWEWKRRERSLGKQIKSDVGDTFKRTMDAVGGDQEYIGVMIVETFHLERPACMYTCDPNNCMWCSEIDGQNRTVSCRCMTTATCHKAKV